MIKFSITKMKNAVKMNNVSKIALNGKSVDRVDPWYNKASNVKQKTLATQQTLQEYTDTNPNDCRYEVNKQASEAMMYDLCEAELEENISTTKPFKTRVDAVDTTSFTYPEDCLSNCSGKVYLSGTVDGDFVVKEEGEQEQFEYNPTVSSSAVYNIDFSYPTQGEVIYIPEGFFDASYTVGTTTHDVKVCFRADNSTLITENKLFIDPECTTNVELTDTNYVTIYKWKLASNLRYYFKGNLYLKNSTTASTFSGGVFEYGSTFDVVSSDTYKSCYMAATRTKFLYKKSDPVLVEHSGLMTFTSKNPYQHFEKYCYNVNFNQGSTLVHIDFIYPTGSERLYIPKDFFDIDYTDEAKYSLVITKNSSLITGHRLYKNKECTEEIDDSYLTFMFHYDTDNVDYYKITKDVYFKKSSDGETAAQLLMYRTEGTSNVYKVWDHYAFCSRDKFIYKISDVSFSKESSTSFRTFSSKFYVVTVPKNATKISDASTVNFFRPAYKGASDTEYVKTGFLAIEEDRLTDYLARLYKDERCEKHFSESDFTKITVSSANYYYLTTVQNVYHNVTYNENFIFKVLDSSKADSLDLAKFEDFYKNTLKFYSVGEAPSRIDVPETVSEIIVSPKVYAGFNSSTDVVIRARALNLTNNSVNVKGKVYIQGTYKECHLGDGGYVNISCTELHLSSKFFNRENIYEASNNKFGDFLYVSNVNLYIQARDLNFYTPYESEEFDDDRKVSILKRRLDFNGNLVLE